MIESTETVSVTEAASVLNVAPKTIRKMLHSGDLRGRIFGVGRGRWRVEALHLRELTKMKRYHCGVQMTLNDDKSLWTCVTCGKTTEY